MFSNIHTIDAREYLHDILKKSNYEPGEATSVAKILLEDAFGITAFTTSHFLTYSELAKLEKHVRKLSDHLPVQYVLGKADFYGLKFNVNKHVLIPRQETEELVFLAEKYLQNIDNQRIIKILDIGTGSGCIPISLAKKFPNVDITAIDVSSDALAVASNNAKEHDVKINFMLMDFLKPSNWEKLDSYDLILSNPPYIPKNEMRIMPKRVVKYEPGEALFVENDTPLIFYKNICEFTKIHHNPHGKCILECNEFNAGEVEKLFKAEGFDNVELVKDISGKDRLVKCDLKKAS